MENVHIFPLKILGFFEGIGSKKHRRDLREMDVT